jgi:8-oxo-dGTP diphosphatase
MTIAVVAAIIERDESFLVTRRPAGAHLAGLWEFPGGKIGTGEGHAAALRREIREELGADVDVGELTYHTTHRYPDRNVSLFFYRCSLSGDPRPLLGQEMRWVQRSDLTSLVFPPADTELIERLIKGDSDGV